MSRFARLVAPALALLGAASTACSSAPVMGVRATTPPLPTLAEGVLRSEETVEGVKGVTLFARSYRHPESFERDALGRGYHDGRSNARGIVIFMNGLKDHGDNYAAVSQHLALKGYHAYAFDLRGEGRSSGARVEVDKFDDYVDDLARYVEHVRSKEREAPIFVYGHSLGGAIVALYAVERNPRIAGVILSGPGIALDGPPVQIAGVRLLNVLAPGAPVLELPNEKFSRDPAVVAGMGADPLVHQPNPNAHLAAEAIDASRRVWAHPERLTVPLLAMHGAADSITAPIGSRDIVARAGSTDKTLRIYGETFHDLVHEPNKDRVIGDLVAWLDAHTGGPPMPRDESSERLAAAPLAGDHGGASTSVQIDARGERASAPAALGSDARTAVTGGLRLRQGFGKLGWLGGLDLRAGGEHGFRWEADGHLLGLGVRTGALHLGLTGGLGARGIDGENVVRSPAELMIEAPLGPLRLLGRGSLAWRLNHGGPSKDTLGIADEANALVGLRLGRDQRYWQDVHAGAGPFLGGTFTRRDGLDYWGVSLGIDLWGAR